MKQKIYIVALAISAIVNIAGATTLSLSQTGIGLVNSSGTSLSGNYGAKFGFWVSGFTPTADNLTSWDENFVAYNGYYQSSSSKFLIAISVGDSGTSSNALTLNQTGFIGGGTQSGATGYGAAFAPNTPLLLLVSNSTYASGNNTNATTNKDYLLSSTSSQYAVLSDSSWKVPLTGISSLDTSTTTFNFSANTTASFGSVSFNGTSGTVSLVPEPSTGALMLVAAFGLAAMQRLRKA